MFKVPTVPQEGKLEEPQVGLEGLQVAREERQGDQEERQGDQVVGEREVATTEKEGEDNPRRNRTKKRPMMNQRMIPTNKQIKG